jgi:hypothetical protein
MRLLKEVEDEEMERLGGVLEKDRGRMARLSSVEEGWRCGNG